MKNDNDHIKILLEKYRSGTCTREELKLLDNWFQQVPVLEELTFTSEEEKTEIKEDMKQHILDRIGQDTKASAVIPADTITSRRRSVSMRIAASLIVLVAAVFVVQHFFSSDEMGRITVTAPAGVDFMPVTLPDRSTVWLASGSTLSYPEKFSTAVRSTDLIKGSAFFSVQHNDAVPFVVHTPKGINVKVLGTTFNVASGENGNMVKVSVLTGRVAVDDRVQKLDTLSKGEQLTYNYSDKTYVKTAEPLDSLAGLADKDLVHFSNAAVKDVVVVLQAMYNVRFVYDPKLNGRYKFNVSFSRSLPIDDVLELFGRISELEFKRTNDEVTIKPK